MGFADLYYLKQRSLEILAQLHDTLKDKANFILDITHEEDIKILKTTIGFLSIKPKVAPSDNTIRQETGV